MIWWINYLNNPDLRQFLFVDLWSPCWRHGSATSDVRHNNSKYCPKSEYLPQRFFSFAVTPVIAFMMSIELESLAPKTTIFRYIIGFILIGLAWGFTTPFIRRAARTHQPTEHPILNSLSVKNSWLRSRLYGAFFGILDILKSPQYAIPLAINLTGSIWFFLLIGKAGKKPVIVPLFLDFLNLIVIRHEPNCANYQFFLISLYCCRRLVPGQESN